MASSSSSKENGTLAPELADPKAAGSPSDEAKAAGLSESKAAAVAGLLGKFAEQLKDALPTDDDECEKEPKVLTDVSLDAVAAFIRTGRAQNVIVLSGAGISTSAGIPDFRSPGSGLYDNLQKYSLPHPQAIFELEFFKENPKPFFTLAKELFPGNFQPTPSHYFIKLLEEKKVLLRAYTQNIDTLERVAGIGGDRVVEAHGSFHSSHCVQCAEAFDLPWIKQRIFADEVPKCTKCDSTVKPDIVFFGENLPSKFFHCMNMDFGMCDLLIVMGTSLVVQPFASLIAMVDDSCPRLLVNDTKVGTRSPMGQMLRIPGFDFDSTENVRDVFWMGTCDDGCRELAKLIGWEADLQLLIDKEKE